MERRRRAVAEFSGSDVPPAETALWLLKPARLVRGTWPSSEQAVVWLGERLREHAPRFFSASERDPVRLKQHASVARERLDWGGDVVVAVYLRQPLFLSVSVVTCSPNRAAPHLPCPLAQDHRHPQAERRPGGVGGGGGGGRGSR
ncbi:hypothetical protein JJV70_11480 [Streptomyces sp. JJ66]|uniref:hypothetical protein n=1 Tax=Streptomyces sp. JJ66 TaxID=2803843 RepID=UPI001C58072E|nr:hypothetical protein [Streptomyces sp. JJ66]MBW1602719.1 hypothetical protein [Streptomyces sp. JJ66]